MKDESVRIAASSVSFGRFSWTSVEAIANDDTPNGFSINEELRQRQESKVLKKVPIIGSRLD